VSEPSRIRVLEAPPPGGVPATADGLLRLLGGPSLLRVPGRDRTRTRAISTLVHGNEPSGALAVHRWLRAGRVPAVDTLVFFASVEAALIPPGFTHRCLPGGCDLNRCFVPPCDAPEARLAAQAVEFLRGAHPEALIDLHNTSGATPPYGIGPAPSLALLALAALFGRVYLDRGDLRLGSLVEAIQPVCPSLVIECGRRGDPASDRVAWEGLERYLMPDRLTDLPEPGDLAVFEEPMRVELSPRVRLMFSFAPSPDADLTLLADLDRHNLRSVTPGTVLGWVRPGGAWPLVARDASGRDRSAELLGERAGELVARRPFTPVMMTTDPEAAIGDCLFYAARRRGEA
jgi:hypothetical protein